MKKIYQRPEVGATNSDVEWDILTMSALGFGDTVDTAVDAEGKFRNDGEGDQLGGQSDWDNGLW